jgi:hypothetical protein
MHSLDALILAEKEKRRPQRQPKQPKQPGPVTVLRAWTPKSDPSDPGFWPPGLPKAILEDSLAQLASMAAPGTRWPPEHQARTHTHTHCCIHTHSHTHTPNTR